MAAAGKLSGVEATKAASRALRGALAAELASDDTQFSEEAYNLLKFHGSYEQYDRDTATERKQAGLEKEWQCMVRVRIPGGRLSAAQYLALDGLADRWANGTLRVTTRQAIQFHGVLKSQLKQAVADINSTLLTTMGACGDVARNVMTTPAPVADNVHEIIRREAAMLSSALLPNSKAHHEIFLDGAKLPLGEVEDEPLYGPTYLPRKFKIALGTPEDNSADLLSNDLALIAIVEDGELIGWNVAIGGGMGMTHNKPHTFPRLGSELAFVPPDQLLEISKAVIRLHRDHGDRSDRKHARLKYVVEANGVDWCRDWLQTDLGHALELPRPRAPFAVPDHLGWHEQGDGRLWLGVSVPSGRIADFGPARFRTGLRAAIEKFGVDPVLTPAQDVLLTNVAPADKAAVEQLLRDYGIRMREERSELDRWALACPAMPTCGLALSEAERIRDDIVAAIDASLVAAGVPGERMSVRITGCPNGCARPYSGDIGIVGRTANDYALFVGGDFEGTRLNFRLLDRVRLEKIFPVLQTLFGNWRDERADGEGFGDYCNRIGFDALTRRLDEQREVA